MQILQYFAQRERWTRSKIVESNHTLGECDPYFNQCRWHHHHHHGCNHATQTRNSVGLPHDPATTTTRHIENTPPGNERQEEGKSISPGKHQLSWVNKDKTTRHGGSSIGISASGLAQAVRARKAKHAQNFKKTCACQNVKQTPLRYIVTERRTWVSFIRQHHTLVDLTRGKLERFCFLWQ